MESPEMSSDAETAQLEPPRFANCAAMTLAGLRGRFDASTRGDIPQQWARVVPQIDEVGDVRVGSATYGACFIHKAGGGFDVHEDGIRFYHPGGPLKPLVLETDVHPGFMTDLHQPLVITLTQTESV